MNQIVSQLNQLGLSSPITENPSMAGYTSFQAGGKADLLVTPNSVKELLEILKLLHQEGCPFIILGKGTNLLFLDGGYPGVVVHLGEPFSAITVAENTMTVGAGAALSVVARTAMEHELTGLEFASGIPGSLGGGVFMNAGAYGGEMKDVVVQGEVVSQDGKHTRILTPVEMAYEYRHSSLMESGEIVLSATLQLKPGDREKISAKMKDFNNRRNQKQPMALPSAGSFFKRPQGHFAGKLIQDAGLAGLSYGGAQVSPQHCGFIVNNGGATAADILTLMHMVQGTVLDKFGVFLEPEVRIIGETE